MPSIKDVAIVLRRLDYSETSQVLAVFTREHGQQRLIARGIKRSTKTRVAVGTDLLEMGRVVFIDHPGREASLCTLTEWRQEDTFPHLRQDLPRCYAAQYAAEATSQLTETGDPHPALFDALHVLLLRLGEDGPLAALIEYLWAMLREVGLRPELGRCISCGRGVAGDPELYFSSRQGGAICRDCEPAVVEKRRIAPELAAWGGREGRSWLSGSNDLRTVGAIFGLLDYHLTETLGRPLRLSGLVRGIFDPGR